MARILRPDSVAARHDDHPVALVFLTAIGRRHSVRLIPWGIARLENGVLRKDDHIIAFGASDVCILRSTCVLYDLVLVLEGGPQLVEVLHRPRPISC